MFAMGIVKLLPHSQWRSAARRWWGSDILSPSGRWSGYGRHADGKRCCRIRNYLRPEGFLIARERNPRLCCHLAAVRWPTFAPPDARTEATATRRHQGRSGLTEIGRRSFRSAEVHGHNAAMRWRCRETARSRSHWRSWPYWRCSSSSNELAWSAFGSTSTRCSPAY
jgi:hypothetical protein